MSRASSSHVTIMGSKLAALRRQHYWTQAELAEQLDMSTANVRRLEQADIIGMQLRNFRRLAELLRVTPDQLRRWISVDSGGEDRERDLRSPALDGSTGRAVSQPPGFKPGSIGPAARIDRFHGVSASAPEDRPPAASGDSWVPLSGADRRFTAVVDGDCMEPQFRDGDVLVFAADSGEREGVIDGKSYFVQFVGGENTFKRVFTIAADPDALELRCWNSRYGPRRIHRDEVQLLARAVYRLVPVD